MLGAASALLASVPALATRMAHRNAEELVGLADRIFLGRCIAVEHVDHPSSLDFDEYTFAVEDGILGVETGERVRFRQFAAPTGGIAVGMPTYEVGSRYLLFLLEDGPLGLTSPVGLGQGAFRLFDVGGRPVLANTFGNRALFRGMRFEIRTSGAIAARDPSTTTGRTSGVADARELVALIRRLAESRRSRS